MTLEAFRESLNAQPFQPFVIHIADGRSIPVVSREFIMRDAGRTVLVYQPDGRLSTIDLLLVTELEQQPAGESPRRRRRREG